jgi:hypothetical protein
VRRTRKQNVTNSRAVGRPVRFSTRKRLALEVHTRPAPSSAQSSRSATSMPSKQRDKCLQARIVALAAPRGALQHKVRADAIIARSTQAKLRADTQPLPRNETQVQNNRPVDSPRARLAERRWPNVSVCATRDAASAERPCDERAHARNGEACQPPGARLVPRSRPIGRLCGIADAAAAQRANQTRE